MMYPGLYKIPTEHNSIALISSVAPKVRKRNWQGLVRNKRRGAAMQVENKSFRGTNRGDRVAKDVPKIFQGVTITYD